MIAIDEGSARSKIRAFILDTFLLGGDEPLADDTALMEQGILDSTGALELVAFLETAFEISVNEREITPENLDSIDRLVTFVTKKLS